MPAVGSRFSRDTTVAELTDWWLDSVAHRQVKTSTLDSYRRFASYLADDIDTHAVVDVGPELLTQWQSKRLDKYAPYTVLNCRKVCRRTFTEGVNFRLIPANPFDLVKAPRAKRVKAGRALSPADAKALITASHELRLGAAVTLLFCQGWRVSEVLGLAWEDLDLDAGTTQIRRGASYTSSVGMVRGSTKTSGAEGIHYLAPVSVAPLRVRRDEQKLERLDLADVARHVGHSGPSTTAEYVRGLGSRPSDTAARAAELLDPTINRTGAVAAMIDGALLKREATFTTRIRRWAARHALPVGVVSSPSWV